MFNNSLEALRSLYSGENMMNMWDIWLQNLNWTRETMEIISRKCLENTKAVWEENAKMAEMAYGQLVKAQDSFQAMGREFVSASMDNVKKTLESAKKANEAA